MRREVTVVLALAIVGVLLFILVHPCVDGLHSTTAKHRIHVPAILVSCLSSNTILSSTLGVFAAYFLSDATPDVLALNCVLLC
jgi:hypothetical protein